MVYISNPFFLSSTIPTSQPCGSLRWEKYYCCHLQTELQVRKNRRRMYV